MRKQAAGFTLTELAMALVLAGLMMSVSATAWSNLRRGDRLAETARIATGAFERARELSIRRGLNHFVVVDPYDRSLSIFEDISLPYGVFDYRDRIVSHTYWPDSVSMGLPAVDAMSDPVTGTVLREAWSMPLPDSSHRWGGELIGVMTIPKGFVFSAESAPRPIRSGTVVFRDNATEGEAVSINVDGRSGAIRSFRYDRGSWAEL